MAIECPNHGEQGRSEDPENLICQICGAYMGRLESDWWAGWKVGNLHNLLVASSVTVFFWLVLLIFFWRTPLLDFITIGVAITTVIHLVLFTMEMAER